MTQTDSQNSPSSQASTKQSFSSFTILDILGNSSPASDGPHQQSLVPSKPSSVEDGPVSPLTISSVSDDDVMSCASSSSDRSKFLQSISQRATVIHALVSVDLMQFGRI
jgi:hypothetical protein